jgi:energy-coupling factor transporter ATP-binding protein EcfA2
MASPIFSLMLPIFFLILPLLIIKMRGLPISINQYLELLKVVCKKHQLGQIFDLSKASFEKMLYVIGSAVFYAIQVYQNIMTCRRFYLNMSKIHEQIFIMRDYLEGTLCNMDIIQRQCQGLKTYEPFIENMNQHKAVYEYMLNELKQVVSNKISIKKFWQVGHIMKCFYQLYQNKEFITSLKYSFGLNGYIDNLNGIRKNISSKNISKCKFKQSKFKQSNNKNKKKINKTKFIDAYFPALVNENPIKNTYTLDKHLLITGPNAAGKTTLLKTTIFNIILSQQIGFGFYKKASLEPYDMIHCYINIPDTSARDSLFQAEAKRCKDILEKIGTESINKIGLNLPSMGVVGGEAPYRHFCVFDELYSGTNPYEAVGSAYAFLTFLNKNDNVNFVLTTHFLDLCRRLEKQEKMNNYHMKIEVNEEDFKYTYKMAKGISTIKGGVKVLKDLDYPQEIINTTIDTLKELEI